MKQHDDPKSGHDPLAFLAGGGEMGERTRAFDWSKTPVGPVAAWPQSLKTAVRIMLDSRYQMALWWGQELTIFYNDAYIPVHGQRHPDALGKPAAEAWSEIWDTLGPQTDTVMIDGRATWNEERLLIMERNGFLEETFFTFSYSPVPNDGGGVGGLLIVCTEDTVRTIGERRLRTLRKLAARTTDEAKSAEDACQTAANILSGNTQDVSFALLYLFDTVGRRATLAGSSGLGRNTPASPAVVDVPGDEEPWPFRQVVETGKAVEVHDLPNTLGPLPGGTWPEPSKQVVVLPMAKPGQAQLAGFIVAGVSPRRPLDDAYRGFLDLLAGQIATAVANARAYEEERRRAEKLAELDRAKTAFFSNVSHEFRTPLTLMLGPVEDLLARSHTDLTPAAAGQLEVVNRNGLRLLRLVNTLLDFSRIEAGRVRAVYQPTDFAAFTADLASVFRAAVERAGLRLVVDCPKLPEPVFVDREMWEKVILNLLSNAFKFTHDGEIAVTLRQAGTAAELRVRDTGTGIPAEEMPRLFERFHRVQNARGRTHEGSGIGLALVQELVKLHGGSVTAESVIGKGTTFTVTVPLGSVHLPPDQIGDGRTAVATGTGASPYVEEALRWLPDEGDGRPELPTYHEPLPTPHRPSRRDGEDARPRVLVADDNADMRQYVARLLDEQFHVEAVPDGEAALAAARERPPALVLTDVMMPRLDGFGLLRELRADPRTSNVPVIMLSARAGEESRVEGMEAGADDYLVKPFSARELLARVSAHLQMARLRRESEQAVRESEGRFRALVNATSDVVYRMGPDWTEMRFLQGREFIPDTHEPTRTWLDKYIHPDDQPRVMEVIREAVRTKCVFQLEHRVLRVDGTLGWTHSRAVPLLDAGGEIVEWFGAASDVTARKQAETELRERETFISGVLGGITDGFFVVGKDWRFTFANDEIVRRFGKQRAEIVGGHIWEMFPAAVGNEAYVQLHRAMADRVTVEYEVFYEPWQRWFLDKAFPTADGGLAVFTRDITDRKRVEAERDGTQKALSTLIERCPFGIYIVDDEFRIASMNEGSQKGAFANVRPVIGRPFDEAMRVLWPEPVAADIIGNFRHTLDTGEPHYSRDFVNPRADIDQTEGYEWELHQVTLPSGRHGVVCYYYDSTNLRRVERELREAEEQFRMMADNISQLAWVCDTLGNVTWYNKRWLDYTGLSFQEMKGWDWSKVQHPDHLDRVVKRVQRSGETGEPWDDTFPLRGKDGEYRWFLSRAVPIRDEAGRIVRWFGTNTDITEQRELQQALEEADRRKDEFLATLAHELRNPLAPLRNGLQIMKLAGGDAGAVEKSRSMMERQVGQMAHLIDDLMDLSRISRGKIALQKTRLRLADAVQDAVDTARPLIEERGHDLVLDVPPEPLYVDADRTRLAQVFGNLLNNAAKYTETGGRIRLAVERQGGNVVVAVEDNGVGIPVHMLTRVFDMFAQIDRSLEKSQGGLGIGLNIVKRLVEMHDGSIMAESGGHGQGSRFVVRLPVVLTVTSDKPNDDGDGKPKPAARRRILVADDNRDAASSLAMLLKIMGNETQTAHDGLEALEIGAVFKPDVVLLDIGMPKLNGLDACRRIREQPWGRNIVIVACTGWGQEDDRRQSKEAGFDTHMVKPVDPTALEKLLAELKIGAG